MHTPIFLFSAGWRSGSTLLQRMLTNTGECLLWGEAGGGLNYLRDAHEAYRQMLGPGKQRYKFGFGGNGEEQFEAFQVDPNSGASKWIASMNPPENLLRDSFRNFFDEYYGSNALELGYSRWGVKEVQSGIDTANFIRILYPKAKFVFLIRNPFDCLLSIKRRNWMDEQNSLEALLRYTRHWVHLAEAFRNADFGLCVRYEDILADTRTLEELRQYLELKTLDHEFSKKNHADWKAENHTELSLLERTLISMVAKKELKQFGYSPK